MTSEKEAYLFAPFLQSQPRKGGGSKKKKQLLGFILSPCAVSTISAFPRLVNQETQRLELLPEG